MVHSTGFVVEGERGLQDATGMDRSGSSGGLLVSTLLRRISVEDEILKKGMGRMGQKSPCSIVARNLLT